MSGETLWHRIGGWLKSNGLRGREEGLSSGGGEAALEADAALTGDAADPAERHISTSSPFKSWNKRDQALQRLQEGFERLSDVIDSVQSHLDVQSQRGERTETCLKRLVELSAETPGRSQKQIELLERITTTLESNNLRQDQVMASIAQAAEREERLAAAFERTADCESKIAESLERSGERDARIAAGLEQVHAGTEKQAEAVDAVGRRLEKLSESDAEIAGAVQQVGGAVDQWNSSVAHQNELMTDVQATLNRSDERLRELLVKQHRVWTTMLAVVLVVAVAALTVGILALVR